MLVGALPVPCDPLVAPTPALTQCPMPCTPTEDMELKKLVYLYLMNYAKSNPDLAIMAVNTFVKVCGAAPAGCTHRAPRVVVRMYFGL